MYRKPARDTRSRLLAVCLIIGVPVSAFADPGAYIGGSWGGSDLDFELLDEITSEPVLVSDDQTAWKVFAGYRFASESLDLAIEGGYSKLTDGYFIDFFPGLSTTEVELTGWPVFGVLGVRAGPVGIFGKAGIIAWDATASTFGADTLDDSGTDLAYGAGLRARWGRAEFRLEYEAFEVDVAEDIDMGSFGFVWNF